jgi:hypothetical protein
MPNGQARTCQSGRTLDANESAPFFLHKLSKTGSRGEERAGCWRKPTAFRPFKESYLFQPRQRLQAHPTAGRCCGLFAKLKDRSAASIA